jgi:hypothetical protein
MPHDSMSAAALALLLAVLLGLAALACGGEGEGPAGKHPEGESPAGDGRPDPTGSSETDGQEGATPGAVRADFRGVHLRVAEGVVLEIRSLSGELVPTEEGSYPIFDDPSSFVMVIEDAEIALSPESLAALLNDHVFAYEGAPFSDLEIELTEDGKVLQKGQLHKAGGVPFSMLGTLGVTGEGDVKIEPEELHTAGLPVENLLDFFGVELDQVVETRESRGVSIDEDTLILDPERALPSPRMRGRVSAVRVEGNRIVQVFGEGAVDGGTGAPVSDRGHMLFRGNLLRFGKLTMHDTDLEIADADPSDPFDFYLERYQEQLTAGYSKTLEDAGLVSYMPDYAEAGEADLP